MTLYVTPETVRSAVRRDRRIAESVTGMATVLVKGRYLSRWARRLRDLNFTREDSVVLAYGSFGLDTGRRTSEAEAILTADQALVRNFGEQHLGIVRRFEQMTRDLPLPCSRARLPLLLDMPELLERLAVAECAWSAALVAAC